MEDELAFPPMERAWRNLLNEVATDLGLFAESVGEEPERCVVVRTRPWGASAASAAVAAGAGVIRGSRKGPSLTDLAPPLQLAGPTMVVLNTVKRDRRTIEQSRQELRLAAEATAIAPRLAAAAAAAAASAGSAPGTTLSGKKRKL